MKLRLLVIHLAEESKILALGGELRSLPLDGIWLLRLWPPAGTAKLISCLPLRSRITRRSPARPIYL